MENHSAAGEHKKADLELWMRDYGTSLLRMSFLYLKDLHLAEDVVQETMLKAYFQYDDFRQQASVKTWLTRTAKFYRRPLRVSVAVFLLLLALSALCIAAELPSKLMDLFEPVNKAVVYDGIELRVVSAVADEDSMVIIYTMRDLKGDRISESTSIYDFSLSSARATGNFPVDFDEETKTKTFCMAGDNGEEMKGRKLTMSVTSFLGGSTMELYKTDISAYDLLREQSGDLLGSGFEVRHAPEDGYNWHWAGQNEKGAELREAFDQAQEALVLPEGSMNLAIPGVDWVTVTNIGYQDGWLHVRAEYDEEKSEINHGYICLTDPEGNQLDNAVLRTPFSENGEEFIISAGGAEELKGVYLTGFFTNYGSLYTGEWEATFKVKGVETKSFACTVETDSVMIDKIVLSPLGVTVYGNGDLDYEPILVHMKDGTEIISEGFGRSGDEETGEFTCKYKFSAPIDIQAVGSIDLAGQTVTVP